MSISISISISVPGETYPNKRKGKGGRAGRDGTAHYGEYIVLPNQSIPWPMPL